MKLRSIVLFFVAILSLDLLVAGTADGEVRLEEVTGGLTQPVFVTHSGDGSGRLFVVEQPGTIRIIDNGALQPQSFLDIRAKVRSGGERGLLGLAFHPNFDQNGRLFVNYTREGDQGLETVVSEFTVSASDPDFSSSTTERVLLSFGQPFSNHNGGFLAFGPEGDLYITTGDGGGAGDPVNAGQQLNTLLGKILRIGVDGAEPYEVPPDNPFVDTAGALPEIWAYGLRNPWRASFDRETGLMFTGDVGQNTWEEVDIIVRGGNYGWKVMEGPECFSPPANCNMQGLILPIHAYGRGDGRSITGGYVYRGPASARYQGAYIFADFVFGTIWALEENGPQWDRKTLLESGRSVSGFGEDEAGNIYVVDYAGSIQQLVLEDPAPSLGLSGEMLGDVAIEGLAAALRFSVENTGGLPSVDPVDVSITLPEGVLLLEAKGTGWSCTAQGAFVDCRFEGAVERDRGAFLSAKLVPGPLVEAGASVQARLTSASGVDPERDEVAFNLPVMTAGSVPLTYAQLALGGGFECFLLLGNSGGDSWQGTATLRRQNDEPWAGDWFLDGEDRSGESQFDIVIEPHGTRKFVLSGDDAAREGYLRIEGSGGSSASQLSASFFYQLRGGSDLIDSTGTPSASPESHFLFPVERTPLGDTGFAYAPYLDHGPFEITFKLYEADGNQVGEGRRSFDGHSAEFFGESFDVPEGFVGMFEVLSASRIFLTVLRLERSPGGFQLTAIPARPVH